MSTSIKHWPLLSKVKMEDPNKAKRDEIMTKLSQEFDEHLQNMTEKNKDFKYDSGITAENFEEVRNLMIDRMKHSV